MKRTASSPSSPASVPPIKAAASEHIVRQADGTQKHRSRSLPLDKEVTPAATIITRTPFARAARRGYSSLLKQVFRATHPTNQRHSERLWPHGSIERDSKGRILTFQLGRQHIPIQNATMRHELAFQPPATPVHMIASGPSIAEIDYAALPLPCTMGMNGSIALAQRYDVHFDYYCVTDTGFIRNRPALVAEIISRDLLFFTTPTCLWHILQHFPVSTLRCRFFLIERVGQRALQPSIPVEEAVAQASDVMTLFDRHYGLGYSEDIGQGLFPGGTVAYESLQILRWLGFRDMYIHGVDLGNAATTPRFYECADNCLPTTLHKQLANEIEPSFRQAAQILKRQGVRVTNLSLISALGEDIFPKQDWRTLLADRPGSTAAIDSDLV